ncbi:MAG: DUF3168 domain-containing protein [Kiloniellaceae bacterium]
MSADSQWPLQQAVYTALAGDAALLGLIGNPARVFDHAPQDSAFPYVVIGEATSGAFDTKTEDGMEQALTIHTWSRYRGLKETKQIMAAVLDALDQQALTVPGHELILLRFTFGATFLDPDGLTRHGVQRFRAVTQAA